MGFWGMPMAENAEKVCLARNFIHMLHVWNIYLYLRSFSWWCHGDVGKYSIHGASGLQETLTTWRCPWTLLLVQASIFWSNSGRGCDMMWPSQQGHTGIIPTWWPPENILELVALHLATCCWCIHFCRNRFPELLNPAQLCKGFYRKGMVTMSAVASLEKRSLWHGFVTEQCRLV